MVPLQRQLSGARGLSFINPQVSVAQKTADFFTIGPQWPPRISTAHLLENTNFSPCELGNLKKFLFDKEIRKSEG